MSIQTQQRRVVEHDMIRDEWRCDMGDGAGTVIIAKTLFELEQDLDWVDRHVKERQHGDIRD